MRKINYLIGIIFTACLIIATSALAGLSGREMEGVVAAVLVVGVASGLALTSKSKE